MTIEEVLARLAAERNYFKQDLSGYSRDEGGAFEYIARGDAEAPVIEKRYIDDVYGTEEDYQIGDAEAPSYAKRFVSRDQELKNAYYADPSNFIQARETPIATGVNTFNEGNENQKRILDQINTGQLVIVPVNYEVATPQSEGQPISLMTGYELKDARTGQTIQQVKAIDEAKGIFNIAADDPNSSGFFNNYVSTDPSGFVNPITSEEQSQYQSKANSSANFYRNVAGGLLSMTGLAFPGIAEAIAGATTLGTVGSNVALNTGINAIKQALTGNIDPLALATSAALSYGSGSLGADAVPGGNEFAGMTSADLASLDATGLINSFADAGLTASEIDRLTREAVETGTQFDAFTSPVDAPVFVQPYDAQLIDPTTGEPFGSIEAPLVDNFVPAGNEFAGMSPTDLASLDSTGMYTPSGNEFAGMTSEDLARLDSTGIYTPAGNEFAGMTSEDLAKLDSTGTSGFSISPMQALRGLSLAKSLLGSGQEQAASSATQFRGTRMPSGQVDYSGILGLLQMQSPQRRSLLG